MSARMTGAEQQVGIFSTDDITSQLRASSRRFADLAAEAVGLSEEVRD